MVEHSPKILASEEKANTTRGNCYSHCGTVPDTSRLSVVVVIVTVTVGQYRTQATCRWW